MDQKGFCGCCSLRGGGIFTGVLASVYNGALIYWYFTGMSIVPSNHELVTALTILPIVLMSLAAVHIAVSFTLIYGVIKNKPDLVMLWIVIYISSCLVVLDLFTIGLAFMLNRVFLYIILCNALFIFNVVMTIRLYNEMVENLKVEPV